MVASKNHAQAKVTQLDELKHLIVHVLTNFWNFFFLFLFSFPLSDNIHLLFQLALYILVAGILCIYINYDCDRQRQEFRRTNGKCLVWGKAPSKVLFLGTHYFIFVIMYILEDI